MIQQWNNLPISQKTYLQASILPPVFQASLQVEETRHRTILHLISMLALSIVTRQWRQCVAAAAAGVRLPLP
eukprot:scaffold17655_cov44-Cyclotella_meneghiniana.AAC.4